MKKLSLGISPCPNDTFIFDQLINEEHDDLIFDPYLEDVETLNQWALEKRLDITKLSYITYLKVCNHYDLLSVGSALGNGVGPLLVVNMQQYEKYISNPIQWLEAVRVAVPGMNTTANFLLSYSYPQITNKVSVIFNQIEEKVMGNEFDAGLLIHENRFTYQNKGLIKIADLGALWQESTRALIPLGGIVVKKSLNRDLKQLIKLTIESSLKNSWGQYPELSNYVRNHAQEMNEEVMRKHIQLYVNEYTTDLGENGLKAVQKLFEEAEKMNWIPKDVHFNVI